MTTAIVGYRLRDTATNEIIQTWGGAWGSCPSVPGLIIVPDQTSPGHNLQVYSPKVGETYFGYILENLEIDEPPAPLVPISRRQFFQAAANANFITNDEALAAMAGTIPATILALVDALPDDASKFAAKMILSGANEFDRDHPLVATIGAAEGQTSDQIDAFWRAAALL